MLNHSNYTSCIKISGAHILPPLITDERRALLAEYKAKAISMEEKLRHNERQLECQLQQQRLPNPDVLNTSSDSSGIFTKSIDSSRRENCRRRHHSFSQSQSELCDNPTVCDLVMNFSNTESSPDKNSTINTEASCDEISELCQMTLSPNSRIYSNDTRSDIDQSDSTYLNNFFDKISPQPQPIAYNNDQYLMEKIDLSSPVVFNRDENHKNMLQGGDNHNSVNVAKVNQQNLNLSPCKDLVLKSDVLKAIDFNNITVRGRKRDLNLSNEFYSFNKGLREENKFISGKSETEDVENIEAVRNVDRNENVTKDKNDDDDDDKKEIIKTPPKLIRQNSYTLDSPSPELLAFAERQRQKDLNQKPGLLKRTHTWTITSDEDKSKKYSTNFKPFKNSKDNVRRTRKAWNVEEAKEQWIKQKKNSTSVSSNSNYKIPAQTKVQARSADCVFSLINNSKSVDNPGVNDKPIRHTGKKLTPSPVSLKAQDDTNLDYNLHNFKNDAFSLKSNDAVKNDHLSTLTPEKDTACDNVSHRNLPYSTFSSASGDCVSSKQTSKNTINCDSISVCSSVSLNQFMLPDYNADKIFLGDEQSVAYYNELRMQHYKQIEELRRKQYEELQMLIRSRPPSAASSSTTLSPPIVSSYINQYINLPDIESTSRPVRYSNELASTRARSCIRQLTFSNKKHEKCPLEYSEKEREAALIITAYTRGYLVRRLFKTDKVLQIIKSIKDSVLCVKNFDLNNQNNWTKADNDLRARLLVQIEAALFAFHEVINLPKTEKIAIIRADYLKKIKVRKVQPDKPALSAVTQRIIMRKNMPPQTLPKSSPQIGHQKSRQRRRSFTGYSSVTNSCKSQQPALLQKSASSGANNRQPWK